MERVPNFQVGPTRLLLRKYAKRAKKGKRDSQRKLRTRDNGGKNRKKNTEGGVKLERESRPSRDERERKQEGESI